MIENGDCLFELSGEQEAYVLERQDGVCDCEESNDKLKLLTGEDVTSFSGENKHAADENFLLITGEMTTVDGLADEEESRLDVAVEKEGVEVDEAMLKSLDVEVKEDEEVADTLFEVPLEVSVVMEIDESMMNIFVHAVNIFSNS